MSCKAMVCVSAYWRFRCGHWEYVRSHLRPLSCVEVVAKNKLFYDFILLVEHISLT